MVFEEAPGDVSAGRHCRGSHGSLGAVPFLKCCLEHLSTGSALFTLELPGLIDFLQG